MRSEKNVVALPFIRERSDKLGHNHRFVKSKIVIKHRKLGRKKTFQKKTKMPRAYVRARKDYRLADRIGSDRFAVYARSVRVGARCDCRRAGVIVAGEPVILACHSGSFLS